MSGKLKFDNENHFIVIAVNGAPKKLPMRAVDLQNNGKNDQMTQETPF